MKAQFFRVFIIISSLLLMSCFAMAQSEQTSAGNPPIEQPLTREGDMAVRLVKALNLGTTENETEAESMLASLDIMPRNGWIADYPVTPDIADELQASVNEAAESGKIAMDKETASQTVRNVLNGYDLPVGAGTSGQVAPEATGPEYPDSAEESNYYYDEGPPVVTYYAPPPDYAYLYTWVPYSFWWSDSFFPGYYILIDFDVPEYRHHHGHGNDHGHDHDKENDHGHDGDRGKFISNHYVDSKSGTTYRVEPGRRPFRGTSPAGTGRSGMSNKPGRTQPVLNTGRGQPATGTYKEFRGYGTSGSHTGTRSSAFDRSSNSIFERNASDRGFQSRSSSGRIGSGRPAGSGGSMQGGGFGGVHGGGGYHGGGGGIRH